MSNTFLMVLFGLCGLFLSACGRNSSELDTERAIATVLETDLPPRKGLKITQPFPMEVDNAILAGGQSAFATISNQFVNHERPHIRKYAVILTEQFLTNHSNSGPSPYAETLVCILVSEQEIDILYAALRALLCHVDIPRVRDLLVSLDQSSPRIIPEIFLRALGTDVVTPTLWVTNLQKASGVLSTNTTTKLLGTYWEQAQDWKQFEPRYALLSALTQFPQRCLYHELMVKVCEDALWWLKHYPQASEHTSRETIAEYGLFAVTCATSYLLGKPRSNEQKGTMNRDSIHLESRLNGLLERLRRKESQSRPQ